MPSERRGGTAAIAVIGALVLVAAGGVAGQYLLPDPAPAPLQKAAATDAFAVEETSFDDARTVQVALDVGEGAKLTVPLEGRVTATVCSAGGVVSSGMIVAGVSGKNVLALHTSVPLWESLRAGDTGDEVVALRQELIRLGADLASDGPVDWAVLNVLTALFSPEGDALTTLQEVPVDQIMWLPQPQVTMLACAAQIGATVQQDDEFGTVAGSLRGAGITGMPADLAPGARTLRVAGVEVEVDESGVVASAEALAAIAATPDYQSMRSTSGEGQDQQAAAPTMVGELVLTEASQAWVVPAATVFAVADGLGCVTSRGEDTTVRIVGSRLGKTFIVPAEESGDMPKEVDTPDAGAVECRGSDETSAG